MTYINKPQDIIFETEYWLIKLDPSDQTYLGRSFVILKRSCGDLADLTTDELMDFLVVVKKFENALKNAFDATMFNWSCLMNNAYQNIPPDPQVHWHVRPRYQSKVKFENETFEDTDFGKHYLRGTNRSVDESLKTNIMQKIKENL